VKNIAWTRLALVGALMVPALLKGERFQQTAAPVTQMAAPVVRRDRVGRTGYDEVRSYDVATRAPRAIYRSAGRIPEEVEVSPDGRYVSFIEAVTSSSGVSRRRLVVIDPRGTMIRAIEDTPVGTYAWCCRSGMVAIIGGEPHEDGHIGFTPETLRLIDVTTGVTQPLAGIEGPPYQLNWTAADSGLYIKTLPTGGTWRVYRYDARSGSVVLTSRKGVFFSPDGRYYYDWYTAGVGFHLYRAVDDVEVTGELASQATRYTRWMPGGGHVLVVGEKPPTDAKPSPVTVVDPDAALERWNLAVDAETKRVTERFQGDIRAWRTSGPALPVERRGGVAFVAPRPRQ
jgi:hypothetical protein